jgi:hypothetical protein
MTFIPFETPPATVQWNRTITHEDYNKILQGYNPQAMEDKYTVRTEVPEDPQRNTVVHVYFGWTPRETMSLDIAVARKPDAKNWATIVKISWKVEHPGEMWTSESKAKRRAVGLCNGLLGCTLEDEQEDEDEDEDENQ